LKRIGGTIGPERQPNQSRTQPALVAADRVHYHAAMSMLVVHVHVHVKPECVGSFQQATIENARNSLREPGIARFDIVQQQDDPTRFVLVEAYRTADAPARHKETAHYAKWRDTVAGMMAEPRSSVKFRNVFGLE
jgi:autoinducer 2-degrading protein